MKQYVYTSKPLNPPALLAAHFFSDTYVCHLSDLEIHTNLHLAWRYSQLNKLDPWGILFQWFMVKLEPLRQGVMTCELLVLAVQLKALCRCTMKMPVKTQVRGFRCLCVRVHSGAQFLKTFYTYVNVCLCMHKCIYDGVCVWMCTLDTTLGKSAAFHMGGLFP